MDPRDFEKQTIRLASHFKNSNYSQEFLELLWAEVKSIPADWFSAAVGKFISESRYAPLLPEIKIEISQQREKYYADEKRKNDLRFPSENVIELRPNSIFNKHDIGEIFRVLRGVTSKKISPAQAREYAEAIRGAVKSGGKVGCSSCWDSGLKFVSDHNGYEYVYRCRCPEGSRQPTSYPIFGG